METALICLTKATNLSITSSKIADEASHVILMELVDRIHAVRQFNRFYTQKLVVHHKELDR